MESAPAADGMHVRILRGTLGRAALLLILGAAVATTVVGPSAAARSRPAWRAHVAQACAGSPSKRDPSNPLALPAPPGPDPLTGANFFVDGPRHGEAAGAIATLLGHDPTSYSDDVSWPRLQAAVDRRSANLALAVGVRSKVQLLEKIAAQPEAQRFSAHSGGGGPGAILGQVNKIFCQNLTADPGSVPIITTYFAHPALGGCASSGEIAAAMPTFRRRIDEMADGTGNHPAVFLLELDALGSSSCMARSGSLSAWEGMLRYEVNRIGALPHTVVYIEAGYSDANSVSYTARALNKAGIRQVKNGNEDLCNPPGRALGPRDTTQTGFGHADAFLWTHVPGNSSGCGGGPPASVFWVARGIDMAAHANERLGPNYPSRPY
ncbi:MAG: glycoside hydrolase family 6 protein [Solirubrobacteraceae bacterium]